MNVHVNYMHSTQNLEIWIPFPMKQTEVEAKKIVYQIHSQWIHT